MNVILATVSGWDSTSIIGVFSTKGNALSESIAYLLKASISMNEDEIYTPIDEEIGEDGSSVWDITNSDDVLVLRVMEVDKSMFNKPEK
jgi:hypothetical protein